MKSFISYIIVLASIVAMIFLTGCPGEDSTPPTIYFHNQDTTVALLTKFSDPGVIVEDNKNYAENIEVESDFYDEVYIDSDSLAWRTGEFEVTYTATDEAGNTKEAIGLVNVKNPSEIIAKTYNVTGDYTNITDTNFTSFVSASNRYAGGVRFSKIYPHSVDGELVYLNIEAYLYDPDLSPAPDDADDEVKFMGTPENPSTPFYEGLSYTETLDMMKADGGRYTYLHIPQKNYTDSTLDQQYSVKGRKDDETGKPLSRVKYFNNGEIKKITLKYNIDAPDEPGSVNETEVYTVRL